MGSSPARQALNSSSSQTLKPAFHPHSLTAYHDMDHPLLASPESPHHQLEKTPAPTTSQSNIGSQVSNNSESGHSATTRKRNRDETDNSAAANDTNPASMTRDDTSPEQQNQQQQQQRRSRRFSSEDLLAPSAKFNKQAFQEACIGDIEETSAEQQALLEEYAQWEWVRIEAVF